MNINLAKRIVFVLGLIPLLRLFVLGYLDDLTANPIEFITRSTGTWTITFLCLTLAMSPLSWITGFSQWLQLRKTLGLFTFFYGFLHFTIWYWLDHDFNFTAMISDVIKRPFITMGFIALLIMSLLAITSNQAAMRLLGKVENLTPFHIFNRNFSCDSLLLAQGRKKRFFSCIHLYGYNFVLTIYPHSIDKKIYKK